MNIQKNILKIARKILADYDYIYDPEHKKNPGEGYERTEKGWSKDKSEKNENGSKKVEMTDEQKKLHEKVNRHYALVSDYLEVSENKNTHEKTLDNLSVKATGALHRKEISDMAYKRIFMVLQRITEHPNAGEKTLDRIINNASAYDEVDKDSAYSRKDGLIGGAIKNPNVSQETIRNWYNDYPLQAASNPSCPDDVLEELSSNDGDYVRYLVFENKNTPKNIREKLSKDKKVMDLYKEELALRGSLRY